MESKPNGAPLGVLRPILTVASQADFAEALRQQRLAKGLTLADLDHIAGFHDGYASHLERPFASSGRRSFKLSRMGVIWLDALGLEICLCQRTKSDPNSALGKSAANDTLPDKDAHPRPRPAFPAQS